MTRAVLEAAVGADYVTFDVRRLSVVIRFEFGGPALRVVLFEGDLGVEEWAGEGEEGRRDEATLRQIDFDVVAGDDLGVVVVGVDRVDFERLDFVKDLEDDLAGEGG